MFKRIISGVLSVLMSVPCCTPLLSSSDDTQIYTNGGIWQSADELPEDCGITVIDCENENITRTLLPQSFDITTNPDTAPFFPPIGNQGQMNSCTAWASTYYQFTYEVNKYKNTPTDETNIMSPAWTYNYINGGQNNSAYINDAYSVLINQGALTLADYPYSTVASEYNYEWSTDVKKMLEALRYRAKVSIYAVDSSSHDADSGISEIKSRIAEGRVGVVWTNSSGWSTATNDSGEKFIVRGSSRSIYGHFMTLVGYDDNIEITVNGVTLTGAFKVANSMGKNWGNDGYIWVSYDALNYTSKHGTEWQSKYSGTRTSVFSKDLKMNFYFIEVKQCNVSFAGYIQFVSEDPWNLTLKAEASSLKSSKKWSTSLNPLPLNNPTYRCLVFDYFDAATVRNLKYYFSRDWTVQLIGNKNYSTDQILSQIIDNLGNPIAPVDAEYSSLTDGKYTKTTSINLAKGRVTSYDDNEITSADSELILNHIVNNVEFSNLQKFLADYNNDDTINVIDVIMMNQDIAKQ